MALTKIDLIYLYTDCQWVPQEQTVTDSNGNTKTVSVLVPEPGSESEKTKSYLDSTNIQYTWLNYADPNQHADLFPPLNTWIFEDGMHTFNSFPFLMFYKCYDDIPHNQWPNCVTFGYDNIVNLNLPSLYALGRSDYKVS